jgi:outer membrane biosynthesis protein TonB
MLQAVGKLCRGGKAMNEPSANSFFVVLLFVLRCLVPLAILFGISYLLRRMGLVAIEAPEPKEEVVEEPKKSPDETASHKKMTSATQPKKPQKRKVSPPRKQTAKKTKADTTRSRSK